jgi:hypothetical protein
MRGDVGFGALAALLARGDLSLVALRRALSCSVSCSTARRRSSTA